MKNSLDLARIQNDEIFKSDLTSAHKSQRHCQIQLITEDGIVSKMIKKETKSLHHHNHESSCNQDLCHSHEIIMK